MDYERIAGKLAAGKERYHRIAAYVVFIRTNPSGQDEVLLCKVRDQNMWALPGGKLEDGEYPLETAKREANEELGQEIIDVPDPLLLKYIPAGVRFFHIATRHMPHFPDLLHGAKYPRTQKSHVFGAHVNYGEFNPQPTKEMEGFRWVTLEKLDELYSRQNEPENLSMRREIHQMAHQAIEEIPSNSQPYNLQISLLGFIPTPSLEHIDDCL